MPTDNNIPKGKLIDQYLERAKFHNALSLMLYHTTHVCNDETVCAAVLFFDNIETMLIIIHPTENLREYIERDRESREYRHTRLDRAFAARGFSRFNERYIHLQRDLNDPDKFHRIFA